MVGNRFHRLSSSLQLIKPSLEIFTTVFLAPRRNKLPCNLCGAFGTVVCNLESFCHQLATQAVFDHSASHWASAYHTSPPLNSKLKQHGVQDTTELYPGIVSSQLRNYASDSHWKALTAKDFQDSVLGVKGKRMSGADNKTDAVDGTEDCAKRPQFGNRFLENPDNVFQHNAWDNVTWDPDQLEAAKKKVEENSADRVDPERIESYETDAGQYWDDFYSQHQNKFFKDRHWLFTEFPELSSTSHAEMTADEMSKAASNNVDCSDENARTGSVNSDSFPIQTSCDKQVKEASDDSQSQNEEPSESESGAGSLDAFPGQHASRRILEVGCGVGNTIFPILQTNADPNLFVYGCDFSSTAVDIVRQHDEYSSNRCHAFVCDVSDSSATFPFPDGSLDIVVMIFVLSAINPDKFQSSINTLARLLKPGGMILFRDYGRYDMAQLRFKKGRCLGENFYVRGDGTRVYFFTQEELRALFTNAGLTEEQNLIDRRLQVNRGRQLTMYRVWIQCKYRKPEIS